MMETTNSSLTSNFKADVEKRMDEMAITLQKSDAKTSKELKYLRGLTTHTHIDVELMTEKWNFNVTDTDREKYMKELIEAGKGGHTQ